MKQVIALEVNGTMYEVAVEPRTTLLEVLRGQIGLTGTKEGCGLGECGACTVLLDGNPALACITLALDARGKSILSIEGLAPDGGLHPIQQSFVEHGAVQCGFCAPGMILSAKALLDENPRPDEEEVRAALSGNLCRCSGYQKIVEAVLAVAGQGRSPD